MEARERERARIASQRSGGIRQAFSQQVVVQRKALIGALKMVYWLAKEEIAHTTKFASLMQLSINLGADYLRELHVGRNACYSSEQIIGELLQCLSQVINPRRACAARVTVVVLCVCVSVCLSFCLLLFSHHGLRGGL